MKQLGNYQKIHNMPIVYKDFYSDLDERNFKHSKGVTWVMDVPMFSIFIGDDLKDEINVIEQNKQRIIEIFKEVRNEIHKIGFPSMHSNVVLRKDIGTAAGNAVPYKKYMNIAYEWLNTKTIVHEWAHLWMFNNSKKFKQAIKQLYNRMLKTAKTELDTHQLKKELIISPTEEIDIIKMWAQRFDSLFNKINEYPFVLYFFKNKKITPEVVQFLPQGIIIDGILKKSFGVSHYKNGYKVLPIGSKVYAEKGNDKWVIGQYDEYNNNNVRYEDVTKDFNDIFEYITSLDGSNIINGIKTSFDNNKKWYLERINNEPDLRVSERIINEIYSGFEQICGMYNTKPTIEESQLVKSWISNYVIPKFLELLNDESKLDVLIKNPKSIYNELWTSNELKPRDTSLFQLVKKIILSRGKKVTNINKDSNKDNFSGSHNTEKRGIIARLNNWVDAYGMSNDDELWATAIEWFFKLSPVHRKTIIKLMLQH